MTEQFKVTAGFRRRADGRLPFYAPGWLAVNEQIRLIKPLIKKYLHGKMADIGCGTKPLQGLCSPYVTEHIGIDHNEMFHDSSNVDIFADAYNIPVPDGYFDCALSTDVFEHLEEPQKAFQETWRILKGGVSLCLLYHSNGICMSSRETFSGTVDLVWSTLLHRLDFAKL